MFRNGFIIAIIASFAAFLFGAWNMFLEVETNACRMTYMFGEPRFSRVNLNVSVDFHQYGLFYYHEGAYKDVNSIYLRGAPVIFVPGNAGSFKQVRSLASVALRKAMDNDQNINLDYFTIDYNEELSALYGGYLETQKQYLMLCIETVLNLYKRQPPSSRKVILIGHSMGGKVAMAVLSNNTMAAKINSILTIATPLDAPVADFDQDLNRFYENVELTMARKRISYEPQNNTNFCTVGPNSKHVKTTQGDREFKTNLDDILLISIGGGNRDLLVRAGLTTSKYSDVHAMTSAIPNVWLSCDHLSSVWCLQFVLTINRFLFNIAQKDNHQTVFFIDDKAKRLKAAQSYFESPNNYPKNKETEFFNPRTTHTFTNWHEDMKKVSRKTFKNGIRQPYYQMIDLLNFDKYRKLYIEVYNVEDADWLYGCSAIQVENQNVCATGYTLAHYIKRMPHSDSQTRAIAVLDLHNLKRTFPHWTHVVVKLPASNKPLHFNVDIHDPNERYLSFKAPRWFVWKSSKLLNETLHSTIYHKLLIKDLDETYQSIKINIEPTSCAAASWRIVSKLCVPWARGFNRYQTITDESKSASIYINTPVPSPNRYNSSENPLTLELYLDPNCRFSISYDFSLASATQKMVQEFAHWLPAHLIAVFLIVLRNQLKVFYSQPPSTFSKPYTGYFQYTSMYIITACRIFKKVLNTQKLPISTDDFNNSFFIGIIVHGTAIVLSILAVGLVWALLLSNGNVFHSVSTRFIKVAFVTSSMMMSVLTTLPLTIGVLTIAVAIGCCSGFGLSLALIYYFIMLSNAYKDYIEEWLWETAKNLIFRRRKRNQKQNASTKNIAESSAEQLVPTAEYAAANDEENAVLMPLQQAAVCDSSVHEQNNLNGQQNKPDNDEEQEEAFEGLQNFAYHITLLLLLFVITMLNAPAMVAWFKNYRSPRKLHDPALMPSIVVLSCLSGLLQIKAPTKLFGHGTVSALLYALSALCILYCQESLYRLNYIVAFAYGILLGHELICRAWKRLNLN